MKHTKTLVAVLSLMLAGAAAAEEPAIEGDYVEARTCDIWTGKCFANGVFNMTGDQAVAAWVVRKGAWEGQTLDGLKLVAVFDSEGTLGTKGEGKVKAAVFIDRKATQKQGEALLALARSLAPKQLENIVKVERKEIAYSREGLKASVTVGEKVVTLKTVPLAKTDTICGNEKMFYPPVGASRDVKCAKTVEQTYRGEALGGVTWSQFNAWSALVGSFSK